jgi:hypothetical protein
VLNQALGICYAFGLSRIVFSVVGQLCKIHTQGRQSLTSTVVQFPRYVPPLHILRLPEPPRKLAQFRVSSLQFPGAELHLGVECIRQRSIAFFAFPQLSLNSFTLRDVTGNFRRADNLPTGVPNRRKL